MLKAVVGLGLGRGPPAAMGLGSSSESGERPAGAAPVDDDEAGPSSYWDMASNGYQELVNAIIRPPRAEYDMDDLGPASFEWHGHAFQRVDLELVNPRGMRLACSHGSPAPYLLLARGTDHLSAVPRCA